MSRGIDHYILNLFWIKIEVVGNLLDGLAGPVILKDSIRRYPCSFE